VGRLGEGATSEVFLAATSSHGRDVAIKRVRLPTMRPDSGEKPLPQRFFAAEAALVGRLQHPNVVQIWTRWTTPRPYLVMEYVPASRCAASAARRAAAAGPDRRDRLQVRDGTGLRGYRQGLIHRDVKPANLLAVMDGDQVTDVKITDFGSVLQPDAADSHAGLPRRLAGLHVARAAGRRARWTAAPTCMRWPRCCTT
jgi:serine/threonine protein kinase